VGVLEIFLQYGGLDFYNFYHEWRKNRLTNAISYFKIYLNNLYRDFCEKYNILPIFITKKSEYKTDITHIMYSNLEEVLEDSLEYIHNDEDFSDFVFDTSQDAVDEYTYMLNILTEYLW
jgi:hypothetical protein